VGFVVYSIGANRVDDGGKEKSRTGSAPTKDTDETFIIKHVSGSATDAGGETVDVTGLGRTQRFSGVKHIIADGGSPPWAPMPDSSG
jgi:hypothetical protein